MSDKFTENSRTQSQFSFNSLFLISSNTRHLVDEITGQQVVKFIAYHRDVMVIQKHQHIIHMTIDFNCQSCHHTQGRAVVIGRQFYHEHSDKARG